MWFQTIMTCFLLQSTKQNILKNTGNPITLEPFEFHCFDKNISYLLYCSTRERKPYSFGMMWRSVNKDIFFIFAWTIPSRCKCNMMLLTYIQRYCVNVHSSIIKHIHNRPTTVRPPTLQFQTVVHLRLGWVGLYVLLVFSPWARQQIKLTCPPTAAFDTWDLIHAHTDMALWWTPHEATFTPVSPSNHHLH